MKLTKFVIRIYSKSMTQHTMVVIPFQQRNRYHSLPDSTNGTLAVMISLATTTGLYQI